MFQVIYLHEQSHNDCDPAIADVFPLVALTSGADRAEPRLSEGTIMPRLEGSYLTGKQARLPDASQGKIALLALGFTYESRSAVEAWSERFAAEFAKAQDVTYYEIPLIGGVGRLARWFIDGGMRRGTPKEKHENVITVYGGVDAWKQRVGYKQPKDAYLILIDRQGTIRWLHAGPFDESRFADLVAAARRLGGSH
jgi:hypothetical protein